MNRLYVHLIIITWTIICLLAPGIVYAQSKSNIDVALVMDSSGSMKRTDPQSLRMPAAKLFISLLDRNDRAAVLSFSDQGHTIAGLTPVNNDADKKKLLHATDRITSKGRHTNLYGAFQKGMEVLLDAQEEGREQIIILMSDGMMDVGDPAKDRQLLDRLKSELSAELINNNVKVYAIAFTEQSDRRLLEKLSKQTGGFYNLALSDRDFHLIFTSIFESLKSPDMLPMEKNSFLIDGSIQEVTIVVSKESAAADIQLNGPDGQTHTGSLQYSGINWFVSDNFDMITVQSPVEGRWEILYSTGENNKAYIITDLKLETNFEQLYAVFGETLDIKAWLEKEGSVITDGEVLETTDIYLELNNPDGNISHLKPFNSGDGIFQQNIIPFKDGNYTLRVVAKGRTYEREKAFQFNVANLQESKLDLKAAREARKDDQAKALQHSEGKEQAPVNWSKIIIQFIVINFIIGILVVAYLKRQSIKNFKLIGTLFKRSQNTEASKASIKEPEESNPPAESAEEASTEKEGSETAQGRKAQAAIEDVDSDAKAPEQGNPKMDNEPERENDIQKDAELEEDPSDDTGDEGTLGNLEEEIKRLEKLRQQEMENQEIEAGKDASAEIEEPGKNNEADTDVSAKGTDELTQSNLDVKKTEEQAPPLAEVKQSQALQSDAQSVVEPEDKEQVIQDAQEGEDSVDDLWADAMNEQAISESSGEGPEQTANEQKTDAHASQETLKEQPVPDAEAENQVSGDMIEHAGQSENKEAESMHEKHEADASLPEDIQDETDEHGEGEIADMWAAALDEQDQMKGSNETTVNAEVAKTVADSGSAEDDSDKDVDQMWAEALSEQAEVEAPEGDESDSKTKQEESPGASS